MAPAAERRPTRVLHVLFGAVGGSTMSTVELAQALAERDIESHAVCHTLTGFAEERRQLLDAFGGRLEFVPLYNWSRRIRTSPATRPLVVARQEVRTGHGLRSAATVRQAAIDRRIDLVHTASFTLPDGAVAARSLGLPHVFHVREPIGPGLPFRIRGEGRRLARVLADERQLLVANSSATAARLPEVAPGLEVDLVPNGLDLRRFDPVADRRDGTEPVRVVAMVGHLHATVKRHDLFVDAAAVVARRHPDLEFRIYGHRDGAAATVAHAEATVRRAREQGVANLVLAGYVADPAEVMRGCDVLVQPNAGESFGRVVVEAMAAKVAVVGVESPALAELVEDGRSGLLTGPAPAELGAAIERMVTETELRAKVVAAARERAWELFSIERCADRIASAYDRLLAKGPGPGEPLARSWATYAAGRFFG
jgi:glycosyltransferase involved in cell wall biosynthesis